MAEITDTKKWIVGIVFVVIVAGIGFGAYKGRTREITPAQTGAVGGEAKKAANDKELLVVKTWSRKDCSLAPYLVTDKLGYFAEEGIKLVFTGETQPAQEIPSILNGNNDVGDAHPNTIAVANAGGAKLRGVVRGVLEPGPELDPRLRHMFWYVNPKSGIKSFADLKNRKGKVKFSTITNNICADFLANLIADKYGVPRSKIEWVSMPDIQAIQALKQGLVDVAGVHPPFYKGMDDAGAVKIADSSDPGLGPTAGLTFYYFSEDFIKKNPEAVRRFAKAIARGQKWANDHLAETAKWTSEAIGVPVTGNHFYGSDNQIIDSQIVPWLADLEQSGVIPKGKIKPSDIVTHEFEQQSVAIK